MTTAHAPQAGDTTLARGWRSFRRWRRGRPFWGGLFLLLSGAELFFSGNLDLGNLQFHSGPSGFLSYVIPAMLVLCGLLSWLSPGQRLFYGILGTLVAVFSLIGLNFGGFMIGLLLGCLGGALTAAWTPSASPVTAAPAEDADDHPADDYPADDYPADDYGADDYGRADGYGPAGRYGDEYANAVRYKPEAQTEYDRAATAIFGERDLAEPGWGAEPGRGGEARTDPGAVPPAPFPPPAPAVPRPAAAVPEDGMLTDQLPTSHRSPLHEDYEGPYGPRHSAGGGGAGSGGASSDGAGSGGVSSGGGTGGAGSADDERPPSGDPLPRRRMRHVGPTLAMLMLAVLVAGTVQRPVPAHAEPVCAPSAAATKTTAPAAKANGRSPTTNAPPPAQPVPSAGGSPAAQGDQHRGVVGSIVGGIVDAVRGLLGGGHNAAPADPSLSPSPSASTSSTTTAPAPGTATGSTGSASASSKASGTPCPSGSPAKPKIAAVDAGQPAVALRPSTITAASITMSGLSFDGVVDLPTKTGTVKVLRFSMRQSVAKPFLLTTPGGPKPLLTKSDSLTLQGNVKFYASKFSGNVLGLIPMTFTPAAPPPLILPELFFTNCDVDLVFVQSDTLIAPHLDMRFAS